MDKPGKGELVDTDNLNQEAQQSAAILIVDDNPLIVNVLKSLLLSEHYQVYIGENGEEALGILSTKEVDVIVCDVMMPRMDGYAFHHAVRQKPEFCHIPFIFLTALGNVSDVNKGRETGVDDYMVKPFDPKNILAVIRGKVKRSRDLKNLSEEKYDAYRKRVIHTLSHEFRTPLVAINTGTELLLEQSSNLDPQRVGHLLEAIHRGSQRLERLVSDFMLMQQIEAGVAERMFKSKSEKKIFKEFMDGFIDQEKECLNQLGVTLSYTNHCQGQEILIYDPQIMDVLQRLINNAVKFSSQPPQIDLYVYPQEKDLIIEVRDRGIGIDVKRIKQAIDVFGQLDREKLEQQGGGLGLAIASRYAKINGGRLEFETREGGGAIVSLLLPVHR